MIKNVIFDVHKVLRLLNNEPLEDYLPKKLFLKYKTRYANTMSKDYIKKVYQNSIFTQYDLGLIARDDLILRLSEKYNEPIEVVKAVMDSRLLKKHNSILKPMIKFIKSLKKHGFKTFILSNMGNDMATVLTKMLGRKNFNDIIFSCDAHMIKPNKDIFEYAVERFKINPSESLFIDDTAPNLEPFKNMGGHTFLFDYKNMDNEIEKIAAIIKNS